MLGARLGWYCGTCTAITTNDPLPIVTNSHSVTVSMTHKHIIIVIMDKFYSIPTTRKVGLHAPPWDCWDIPSQSNLSHSKRYI